MFNVQVEPGQGGGTDPRATGVERQEVPSTADSNRTIDRGRAEALPLPNRYPHSAGAVQVRGKIMAFTVKNTAHIRGIGTWSSCSRTDRMMQATRITRGIR